jgi:hypothetical protein
MQAYKCPFCPDWHVGHTIKNRKQRATVIARRRKEEDDLSENNP